jgi:hypothetical protein
MSRYSIPGLPQPSQTRCAWGTGPVRSMVIPSSSVRAGAARAPVRTHFRRADGPALLLRPGYRNAAVDPPSGTGSIPSFAWSHERVRSTSTRTATRLASISSTNGRSSSVYGPL